MQKSKIYSLLILAAAFWFSNFTVKAQQHSPIDIKSLTLSFKRNSTEGQFSLRAINSSQNEVVYAGQGGYSLPLFNCVPCNLPNSFNSNGFQRGSGFQFSWGFDKLVYFYVSEVKSDVIVLRPTVRRKPRLFSFSGRTEIHGRVEIRDNTNTIVAFDNEVKLEGSYTVNFLNNNSLDGRKVEFSQISYSLNQAAAK
jgi:hypothetical protein